MRWRSLHADFDVNWRGRMSSPPKQLSGPQRQASPFNALIRLKSELLTNSYLLLPQTVLLRVLERTIQPIRCFLLTHTSPSPKSLFLSCVSQIASL